MYISASEPDLKPESLKLRTRSQMLLSGKLNYGINLPALMPKHNLILPNPNGAGIEPEQRKLKTAAELQASYLISKSFTNGNTPFDMETW